VKAFCLLVSMAMASVWAGSAPQARAESAATVTSSARERWEAMPRGEKDRIRENYRRWEKMDETTRQDLKRRHQTFQKLPDEKRAALLEQHRRFKQLSPEKQQRIRENFEKFRKLPPEQRAQRLEQLRRNRIQSGDSGRERPRGGAFHRRRRGGSGAR
jgi:hypothetical protein